MGEKKPREKELLTQSRENMLLTERLRQLGVAVRDLRSENFKEKKGVWWVQAGDDGLAGAGIGPGAGGGAVYILKKLSVSHERLEFILSATTYLRERGSLIPAPVNLPASGLPYFEHDGAFYILSEVAPGRAPRYDVPKDLELIARTLAEFHRASRGFRPPAGSKERAHLGRWGEDYRQKREKLDAFAARASGEDSQFARAVSAAMPHFRERAARAEEDLGASVYDAWCEEVSREPILCHQDFAAGNLALVEQPPPGRVWIFDTDSITVDLPARDLRKVLNKALKKSERWDPGKANRFLDAYRRVFPLTREQLDVLRVDLTFPHLFYGIVSKYFEGRESEWSESKFAAKLARVIEFEKSKEPFLDGLKEG